MQADIDKAMAPQFEGNFMDASDLMSVPNATITLTISDLVAPGVECDATKKLINKAILSFSGAKKRLILNKTNAVIIKMMHGKCSDWIGKKITLTVRWLEKAFKETNVPVIRVVPPEGLSLPVGMRQKYGSATSFAKPNREPGCD